MTHASYAPSEERLALADSAARLARERYETNEARPFEATLWRDFAELGWLAAPLQEASGGLALPWSTVSAVVETLGAGGARRTAVRAVGRSGLRAGRGAPRCATRPGTGCVARGRAAAGARPCRALRDAVAYGDPRHALSPRGRRPCHQRPQDTGIGRRHRAQPVGVGHGRRRADGAVHHRCVTARPAPDRTRQHRWPRPP
jgi:alkylation response protein AidB-like acyl-CoA dehydrogenase